MEKGVITQKERAEEGNKKCWDGSEKKREREKERDETKLRGRG